MVSSQPGYPSAIQFTAFSMKCVGFWIADTPRERLVLLGILYYSIITVIFAIGVTGCDLYFTRKDFQEFSYSSLNFVTVSFGLLKLVVFASKRSKFLELIQYVHTNFWCVKYDHEYDARVIKDSMTKGLFIVVYSALISEVIVLIYAIKPILGNRGLNETEKILPFRIWLDFIPVSTTPWYEITYGVEMFSAFHCGFCYFCFDNFLCQINLSLVSQFKILNFKFRTLCDGIKSQKFILADGDWQGNIRLRLNSYIKQHQQLIILTDDLKNLYTNVILGEVVILSFLICLEFYQLLTTAGELIARIHYILYGLGSLPQLFSFTYTCNDLTEASKEIADATWEIKWWAIKSGTFKNSLLKDLSMIIMRSQRACSLTVGGFSPVTLRTFTSICNSAFSYLTLIRQGRRS